METARAAADPWLIPTRGCYDLLIELLILCEFIPRLFSTDAQKGPNSALSSLPPIFPGVSRRKVLSGVAGAGGEGSGRQREIDPKPGPEW
jgi:hypothetical protein